MASFIATVTDPSLRREIFMGMDEAAIANLPPNLMAEARGINDYRRQRDVERARLMQDMAANHGGIGAGYDQFGQRNRQRPEVQQRVVAGQRGEKTLDNIVNTRQKQLASESPADDIAQSIGYQIIQNEKILEALLIIMLTNDKAECELIPCLVALTKIQSVNGVPVIRNKIVNAITFMLKSIGNNDTEALSAILPNNDIKLKQCALILIGTFRLLLKANKSLMKFILKGLITKDESQIGKSVSSQILKKQFKALNLKFSLSD